MLSANNISRRALARVRDVFSSPSPRFGERGPGGEGVESLVTILLSNDLFRHPKHGPQLIIQSILSTKPLTPSPSPLRGNAVKHFRTAGACPTVGSFGVLDSRRPIACLRIRRIALGGATNLEVSFSSRGLLEHQSGVRSGRARAGQNDKYQKSMSAKVTSQNSHFPDATIEMLPFVFVVRNASQRCLRGARGAKSKWGHTVGSFVRRRANLGSPVA